MGYVEIEIQSSELSITSLKEVFCAVKSKINIMTRCNTFKQFQTLTFKKYIFISNDCLTVQTYFLLMRGDLERAFIIYDFIGVQRLTCIKNVMSFSQWCLKHKNTVFLLTFKGT